MIRTASEIEIRNVGCPLWILLGSWASDSGQFDPIKRAACAIVAHLAYCAIGADEKERRNRAKVVPCRVYQTLIGSGEVNFTEALRGMDFAGTEVIRTRRFVAVLIPAGRDRLLIGIRGTQFAYDWLINANIWKKYDSAADAHFHAGFLREADKLFSALQEGLRNRFAGRDIYIAGHSLGGAVAAIINQWMPVEGCYIFGSPRIGVAQHIKYSYQPFATRRHLDIVPHLPPSALGYDNFLDQVTSEGQRFVAADGLEWYFFASWLLQLSLNRYPQHHSMERYRREVLEVVKQMPNFTRSLANCPDIEP